MALMGLSFEVAASDVDENARSGEHPQDMAMRLSKLKAEVAAQRVQGQAVIVAADTLVALEQHILGKPVDAEDAYDILARLRNRQHMVYSGLTLIDVATGQERQEIAATPVLMRNYSNAEIRRYIATGDPMDKAGAYAIQHPEFEPVARIDGCFANVMGLPMCHLYRALSAWGVVPPTHPLRCCPLAMSAGCCWSQAIIAPPSAP